MYDVVMLCCRLGRRRSLVAYYATAGIALILSQVIPEKTGQQTNTSRTFTLSLPKRRLRFHLCILVCLLTGLLKAAD